MRYLFFLFLISAATSVHAQSYEIEWGELQRSNGQLLRILPDSTDEFYALRWTGGRLFGRYQVSRHEDLEQINRNKISITIDGSIGQFEGARVFGGRFFTFISDRKGSERIFAMQEYSKDLEPVGDEIQLAAYDVEKFVDRGSFDVVLSQNEKYLGIVWEIPGKKDERDKYGFKIFDRELNPVIEGDYPLPFSSELSVINHHHISNTGEYFLSVTEYEFSEKQGVFKNNKEFKAVHIFHIAEDGLQDFTLDFSGERIEALAVSTAAEGYLTITGLYGPTNSPGVSGVFFQRVDLKTREVLSEGFKEFSEDFIMQDWSDREIERAQRREERGKGEPQLYNYIMREAQILPDGSIIGTMEQFYIQVSATPTGQTGQMSNVYNYYYNDIIAYKINPDGEFEWVNKINKYQVSTNDGGPYSSYESFMDDGKLYFIFNDNSYNYNNKGEFIGGDRMYAATYSKRRNVVALASVDIETGEMERSPFFERSEIEALVVPKLFHVNNNTGEMLIYAIWGRKEKFGLLKFKN